MLTISPLVEIKSEKMDFVRNTSRDIDERDMNLISINTDDALKLENSENRNRLLNREWYFI